MFVQLLMCLCFQVSIHLPEYDGCPCVSAERWCWRCLTCHDSHPPVILNIQYHKHITNNVFTWDPIENTFLGFLKAGLSVFYTDYIHTGYTNEMQSEFLS